MINKALLKYKTLLYVEDDENTREEIAFFLEKFFQTIYTAKNGKEGLEFYKKYSPDIVITDVQMPIMNGIDMAKKIKLLKKNTPIIVTTAFNETDYLLNAINNGVSRYLLKPLNMKKMLNEIVELLDESSYQALHLSLDEDEVIMDANQEWLDFLGYDKNEVIGNSFRDFVHSDSANVIEKNCKYLKEHGFLDNVNLLLIHKNGSKSQVILNAKTHYSEDDKFIFTDCELKNIDFFRHSEYEINKLLEKERYISGLITTYASISNTISKASSLDLFLDNVTDVFIKNVEFEYAFISLYRDNDQFEIVSQSKHKKLNMIKTLGKTFKVDEDKYCPTCESFKNNKIIIIDDITQLKNFRLSKQLDGIGINAITAIPLKLNGDESCIGILTIMFNKAHKFAKEELGLFHSISETISFGMQAINDRVEKEKLLKELDIQATTDALTRCANRHKGSSIGRSEVQRSHRYNRPLSILYFDIDYFKMINDTYGHAQGDKALISIAKTTQSLIRTLDTVVRWGGEEFIVILPECNLKSALITAEKLRSGFEKKEPLNKESITASFGVAELQESESWESLIRRADDLMYKAKDSGRNRVVYA